MLLRLLQNRERRLVAPAGGAAASRSARLRHALFHRSAGNPGLIRTIAIHSFTALFLPLHY